MGEFAKYPNFGELSPRAPKHPTSHHPVQWIELPASSSSPRALAPKDCCLAPYTGDTTLGGPDLAEKKFFFLLVAYGGLPLAHVSHNNIVLG